jgi:hypothetical protein
MAGERKHRKVEVAKRRQRKVFIENFVLTAVSKEVVDYSN